MCRTYTDYKRRMCGIFMEREQLRDRLVEAAGLPRDVLQKAPVLTVTGDFEVFIGNYRGIAEYSDDLVRIRTRTGHIRVAGNRLQVDYYTNDEMKVTGKIEEIRFENGRDEA